MLLVTQLWHIPRPAAGEVFDSARLVALLDRVRASLPLHAQQEPWSDSHAMVLGGDRSRCLDLAGCDLGDLDLAGFDLGGFVSNDRRDGWVMFDALSHGFGDTDIEVPKKT